MDEQPGGAMDRLLMTVDQAEEMTMICRSKLYLYIASGALRSIKVGRSRRIARVDLEAFVERLRTEQLEPQGAATAAVA